MTNWYAYRWVCDNCRAVHYFEVGICRRCGCKRLTKKVNNQKLVDELESGKRARKTWGPENVERETEHGPQKVEEPAHPPEEEEDTGQQPEDTSDGDPLDDLINDIMEG